MSKIQIDEELFVRLCRFHLLDDVEQGKAIKSGLTAKLDAIQRRNEYTQYKTANTEEERETARKRYLDAVGVPDAFRW